MPEKKFPFDFMRAVEVDGDNSYVRTSDLLEKSVQSSSDSSTEFDIYLIQE